MLAETTLALRRLKSEVASLTSDQRFVDYGVLIHVVEQAAEGDGVEVLAGRPPVVSIGQRRYGGIFDTRTQAWVGPSENPVTYYCSSAQLAVFDPAEGSAPKQCVLAAMGSGKTYGCLAKQAVLWVLQFAGQNVEIGLTAPTDKRLSILRQALFEHCPPDWFQYRAAERLFLFNCGVRIRLASTKIYSEELGSPIQGWDWVAHGGDEYQDSLGARDDIQARLRRAPGGIGLQLVTCTAKDNPTWRAEKARMDKSPLWDLRRLEGRANPFVWQRHWDNLKVEYDERTYKRLVLALDVGPERAVYTAFDRSVNVRPLPLGAKDVTAAVLAPVAQRADLLIGHDPGQIQQVSEYLRAYILPGDKKHSWWVVGERVDRAATTEAHSINVRQDCSQWGMFDDMRRTAHVRIDPYGLGDNKTHKSVHDQFRHLGFSTRSALVNSKTGGPGRIHKEERIEMINRLLKNALGQSRLFIQCDDSGTPCAPRLVDSLEMAERDVLGKAETKNKSDKGKDLSDAPAALGYALLKFERISATSYAWRAA